MLILAWSFISKLACTVEALLYANTCLCNIFHGILLNGQVRATSSVNDDADHMFNCSPIHCIDTKMFCISLSLLREKRDLERKSFH